jgi:hypothetical protein
VDTSIEAALEPVKLLTGIGKGGCRFAVFSLIMSAVGLILVVIPSQS